MRFFFLFLVSIAIVAAMTFGALALNAYTSPGPLTAEKLVYIEPGSPVKNIGAALEQQGVVDNVFFFRFFARLHQAQGSLKAGEYQFVSGMTLKDVLLLLQSGKTYQRKITIPEGLTSVDIVAAVKAAEGLTGDIVNIPADGTLLPETYSYSYNDTRDSLMARMQQAMSDEVKTLWAGHDAADVLLKTPQDMVTLASIVEKETGLAEERPRVAGVFINRLKAGMALQSDPTVIYAVTLGKTKLDRPLSRKDLNIDSPYNTYIKPGLPPTPIANPGRASLEAVMHPEQNGYFYFVADGTGGHAFATTLDEHTRNVAQWRRIESGQGR